MVTAESMMSKRPVLRMDVALFFLLKLFTSHIYCIFGKLYCGLIPSCLAIQLNSVYTIQLHLFSFYYFWSYGAFTNTRHASKNFCTLFVLFYCSPITRKLAKSFYINLHYNFSRVIACRASRIGKHTFKRVIQRR